MAHWKFQNHWKKLKMAHLAKTSSQSLNTYSKHRIVCVSVCKNSHMCAERAHVYNEKLNIFKISTGGINWKLFQNINILGTSTYYAYTFCS